MADLLKQGTAWLNTTRRAKMASSVTYRRGGSGNGFSVAGTVGRTGADQVVESDLINSAGIRDWIFSAADFFVSQSFVAPAPLDTIEEADETLWQVTEIAGEPCWRWSDDHRQAIRVHVIKV